MQANPIRLDKEQLILATAPVYAAVYAEALNDAFENERERGRRGTDAGNDRPPGQEGYHEYAAYSAARAADDYVTYLRKKWATGFEATQAEMSWVTGNMTKQDIIAGCEERGIRVPQEFRAMATDD